MLPTEPTTAWTLVWGVADIDDVVRTHIDRIPHSVSSITYAPTGSLLPPTLAALYRHIPISWMDPYGRTRPLDAGPRLSTGLGTHLQNPEGMHLLLCDIANSADEIQRLRHQLGRSSPPVDPLIGAIVAAPDAAQELDLVFVETAGPTIAAPRLLHDGALEETAVALEGVIGPTLSRHLRTRSLATRPSIRPSVTMGLIVSDRTERDRVVVTNWLRRYDIQFRGLAMVGALTRFGQPRRRVVDQLAKLFVRNGIRYIIESDMDRAAILAGATSLPTVGWSEQRSAQQVPGRGGR